MKNMGKFCLKLKLNDTSVEYLNFHSTPFLPVGQTEGHMLHEIIFPTNYNTTALYCRQKEIAL